MKKEKKEEYFPRGGKKVDALPHRGAFTFSNRKRNKKAKEKVQRKKQSRAASLELELSSEISNVFSGIPLVPRASYQMLSEGMKLCCAVNSISPSTIFLNLPGRLLATVSLTKRDEPNMVKPGQIVCCSVVKISQENHRFTVEASIDPKDVNSDLSSGSISKGDVIQVSVGSIEDHGYLMDCGINGAICFLPQEGATSYLHCQGLKNLVAGQIMWAKVIETKPRGSQNFLSVSVNSSEIKNGKLRNVGPDRLRPGGLVGVIVEKILSNGIAVSVPSMNVKGFVESSYLKEDWSEPSDFNLGQKLTALLLYKLPFTESYFFSLKNETDPFVLSVSSLKGKSTGASVFNVTRSHIILKLHDAQRCAKGSLAISEYRPQQREEDLAPAIGTKMSIIVDHYNYLDRIFICSTKKKKMSEDLKVGDVIEFTTSSLSANGVQGGFRSFKVIVPSHEVPDPWINKNTFGIQVEGEILSVNEKKKILTVSLKNVPTKDSGKSSNLLLNHKLCDVLSGTVKSISPGWVEVEFPDETSVKIQIPVYSKQTYALNMNVDAFFMGLTKEVKPVFSLQKCVFHGGEHCLTVVQHLSDSILMEIDNTRVIIYDSHLSDHIQLCASLKKTLQPGRKIQGAVWCGVVRGTPIFSLKKSYRRFVEENLSKKLPSLNGKVLPTSVSYSHGKPQLDLPIRPTDSCSFLQAPISNEVLRQYGKRNHKGATIYGKIEILDDSAVNVDVSDVKISLKESLHLLLDYLKESESVKHTAKRGSIHEVTIVKVFSNYALVKTKDGFEGSLHCKDFKIDGKTTDAYLLFQDPISNKTYFYIGNPHLNFSIKEKNFLKPGQRVNGKVIAKTVSFFIFLVSGGKCKGRCVYIPAYLHPNFQIPCFSWDDPMECVEVILVQEEYIVGVFVEQKELYTDASSFVCIPQRNVMSAHEVLETNPFEDEINYNTIVLSRNAKKTESQLRVDKLEENNKYDKGKRLKKDPGETLSDRKRKYVSEDSSSSDEDCAESLHPLPKICPRATNPVDHQSSRQIYPSLEEAAEFLWTATSNDLGRVVNNIKEEPTEGINDEEIKTKLTPAQKRKRLEEKERQISKRESEILEIEKNPRSSEHFERLIAATPNDSKTWIQYMSLHLQATEIDKARSVARRAFKTINVRQENEKLNVWTALLNLENLYGTAEDFQKVLREAVKYNDEYEIYNKVLRIYESGKKEMELENIVSIMLRKHKDRPKCWMNCLSALMSCEIFDKARLLLQRCLKAVPAKNHVSILSQFALLENKHGNEDEAHAIFESIVSSYPGRVDVWSVYADMLVKRGQISLARQILTRAVRNQLPMKKLRALYAKWLSFEEKFGTKEEVSNVKQSASICVKEAFTIEEA